MILKQQTARGTQAVRKALDSVKATDGLILEDVTSQSIQPAIDELKKQISKNGKATIAILIR